MSWKTSSLTDVLIVLLYACYGGVAAVGVEWNLQGCRKKCNFAGGFQRVKDREEDSYYILFCSVALDGGGGSAVGGQRGEEGDYWSDDDG